MIEPVVFDMARTTIDAGDDAEIFRATLARWSVPVTGEQIAAVRGARKRQAMADLLERHAPDRLRDLDAIHSSFREALTADRFKLYPGADDAVRARREQGIRAALNTGFDRSVAGAALDLQAGFNAGVKMNVGVCSGAHSRARLAVEPPTNLLESVADVATLFTSRAAAEPSERQ